MSDSSDDEAEGEALVLFDYADEGALDAPPFRLAKYSVVSVLEQQVRAIVRPTSRALFPSRGPSFGV